MTAKRKLLHCNVGDDSSGVKELIFPHVATVIVYDTYGEPWHSHTGCRIVLEYCEFGEIAHVFIIPPKDHPNAWQEDEDAD